MGRYLTEVLADSPAALWHLDEFGTPFTDVIGEETAGTGGPAAYLQYPAIYTSVLSAARVLAHYNAGLVGDGVIIG